MTTDSLYYVPHVIIFVMGGVLFGCFVRRFHIEILAEGWVLTPRSVWLGCCVCSSFWFVLFYLDPLAILGIYTYNWALFLGWVASGLVLDSVACTVYMYVIVLYKQHLTSVPDSLTRIWLVTNLSCTFLVILGGLIGTISNDRWWYGFIVFVIILQEVLLTIVINISLHRITNVLTALQEATKDNFHQTIRKMWVFRLNSSLLAIFAIVIELLGSNDAIGWLESWGDAILPPDTDEFDFFNVVPDLVLILCHSLLLFGMRRPHQSNDSNNPRLSNRLHHSASDTPSIRGTQTA